MPDEVEVYDPHNMIHENSLLVSDLETALKEDLHLSHLEFNSIVVCGMGGSAIGGDIVADSMYSHSLLPITVWRYPYLPGWVNEKTLMIISSYSGNTAESLSAYEQAIKRKCPIVSITSGGDLMKFSERDGVAYVTLKKGIQPRNAVGYTIGYLINVIASVGGPDIRKECISTLPALYKYIDDMLDLNGLPRQIATELYGHLPVIYSVPEMYAISRRWRAQFNENAKILSFDGLIPDTNHNDIVGLLSDGGKKVKPILLTNKNQSKMMREIINNIISTLKERGLSPYVVTISGKNLFERTLKTLLLGDFVSLHLAFFQSIDPSDVSIIKKLKVSVAKRLTGKKKRK